MYLKHLEDYVVELASTTLENTGEFTSTGEVVSRLMEILVLEESLIPDFVVNGDSVSEFEDSFFGVNEYDANLHNKSAEGEKMKTLAWLGIALITGAVGFIIGFLTAPA
jgi:hypothetical protein